MSRATCKRRIGKGIASPRASGNPSVSSARRRTQALPGCSGRGRATPRTAARPRTSSQTHRGLGAGVGDRVVDERGADLRGAACSDVSPVERQHLRRVGRVDEVERGSVRDVVAVEQRRLVPVRRAPGSVEESDVVRVGKLPCRSSASSPRRTASTAVRSACSRGCPVPRSVASDKAPTTSAARIGRHLRAIPMRLLRCPLQSRCDPTSVLPPRRSPSVPARQATGRGAACTGFPASHSASGWCSRQRAA